MAQKYKPVIRDGEAQMIPDQLMGFWVRFDEYTGEIAKQSADFSNKHQQDESGFFDELDRLEAANKDLHARIKELEK